MAAGQLGGTPPVKGQQLNASIIAQTRLTSADEFSKILLKVNQDGSQVRLRDVAKVELGGENYDVIAKFNGKPASGLGIKLATGANARHRDGYSCRAEEDGTVLPVRSENRLSV